MLTHITVCVTLMQSHRLWLKLKFCFTRVGAAAALWVRKIVELENGYD